MNVVPMPDSTKTINTKAIKKVLLDASENDYDDIVILGFKGDDLTITSIGDLTIVEKLGMMEIAKYNMLGFD